jgi:hypothetical protein
MCAQESSLHTYHTENRYRITNILISNIYYTNNVLHKTKSKTLEDIAAEWLHNSTSNRSGVIVHLELLIKESQIFFSFWAACLSCMEKIARLSTLMVGTQQVVGKIWYAGHIIKDKAITRFYVEKQLHIDSLMLKHPIYYVISTLDMPKLTTLPRPYVTSPFHL